MVELTGKRNEIDILVTKDKKYILIPYLLVTLCAILGGYFVYRATHWSPWAFSDSAVYLSTARNFGEGRGLVIMNSNGTATRMTEFAPLYPVVLSLLTGRNGNFIETARWLNIFSFAFCIFLSGLLIYKITRNSFIAGCVSLFIALSPVLLDAFTGLMSEPLFILLLIIHSFLLWSYISDPDWKKLISLAAVSTLLPLTRYAGIIFPISTGFLIFLLGKHTFNKNLFHGASFTVITLMPIGLWFLDLYLQLNKVGGKRFSFDFSIFGSFLRSIFSEYFVLRTWYPYYEIYPSDIINRLIEIFFTISFLFIFFIGMIQLVKNWRSPEKSHLFLAIGFSHNILYVSFIAITHTITVPQIDIINRMLAPILPLGFLVLGAVFSMENNQMNKIPWKVPVIVLLAISARFNFLLTTQKVSEYYENGFGFNSRENQQSGLIDALHDLDPEKPMISNSAAFVLFHTNRLPLNVDHFHNRRYGSSDGYGEKTFRERNAPLIIHIPDFLNSYGENADDLLETLTTGLVQSYADPIGAIYYFAN